MVRNETASVNYMVIETKPLTVKGNMANYCKRNIRLVTTR